MSTLKGAFQICMILIYFLIKHQKISNNSKVYDYPINISNPMEDLRTLQHYIF